MDDRIKAFSSYINESVGEDENDDLLSGMGISDVRKLVRHLGAHNDRLRSSILKWKKKNGFGPAKQDVDDTTES